MAKKLEYVITGDVRDFNRALSSVDKRLGQTQGVAARAGKSIARGFGYATVAIGAGLVVEAKRAYKAFEETRKISAQTEAVLKSTGGAAKVTAKEIAGLATEISRKTGIDDEAIQSAENLLLTFTNVRNEAGKGNKVFSETTRLAVDMATALGTDAKSAAMQLGKALNDPEKGVTRLTRSGVMFTDQQKEQIATLQESGDILGAQKVILREVAKEFGGSAQAQATNLDKAKVAVGNLEEAIGAGLSPVVDAVSGEIADFAKDAEPLLLGVSKRINRIFGRNNLTLGEKLKLSGAEVKEAFGPFVKEGTDLLGKTMERAAPKMIDAAAAAAPHAASAFVKAFQGAGVWGKILTGAFLAKKLGGFSALGKGVAGKLGGGGLASKAQPVRVYVTNKGFGGPGGGPGGGGKPSKGSGGGGFLPVVPLGVGGEIGPKRARGLGINTNKEDIRTIARLREVTKGLGNDVLNTTNRIGGFGKEFDNLRRDVSRKALKIVADDKDPREKIAALKKLPLPKRIQKILGENKDAKTKLKEVKDALDKIPDKKTVRVTTVYDEVDRDGNPITHPKVTSDSASDGRGDDFRQARRYRRSRRRINRRNGRPPRGSVRAHASSQSPMYSTVVALGKWMQSQGFQVGEHPAFGGVAPVHKHYPPHDHYSGGALDVNADASGDEYGRLTWLAGVLRANGWNVLWQVADHYDHLHVDSSRGGRVPSGAGGSSSSASASARPRRQFKARGRLRGGHQASGARESVRQYRADLAVRMAEAQLTPGIEDDKAILTERINNKNIRIAWLRAQLRRKDLSPARRRKLTRRLAEALGDLGSLQDERAGLVESDESNRLAEAMEELAALMKEKVANDKRLLAIAESEPSRILNSVIAALNGDIGGKVGLGFASPSYAGQLARY